MLSDKELEQVYQSFHPDLQHHRGPAQKGAWKKGFRAAAAGLPIGSCPYADHLNRLNGPTFSRGYAHAWEDGYRAFQEWKDKQCLEGC